MTKQTANLICGDCMPPKCKQTGRFLKGYSYSPRTQFKKGEHWRPRKPHWDREWLRRRYEDEKMSAPEIAGMVGCTDIAILFWMRKHGIPRRSMREARKIKRWAVQGEANGMHGKRGAECPSWKGGTTPYRQHIYSTNEWGQFARSIFARDRVCVICGANGKRHIHHIICVHEAPLLIMDPGNVCLLCEKCHHKTQGKERKWRKKLFAIMSGRKEEQR